MALKAKRTDSILIVVDEQPKFMAAIWERERVLARSDFLVQIAVLLGVPVVATVQNPDRMGGLDARFDALDPIAKMSFSCGGAPEFVARLKALDRRQVVLVGIETHICVSQTAMDLLVADYEVIVCPDAVSARTVEMHKLGMERLRDSGVLPMHSEAVAYEWLETAENPDFRPALKLVKEFAGG